MTRIAIGKTATVGAGASPGVAPGNQESTAQAEALRSGGFCCHTFVATMASSDFTPRRRTGLRVVALIPALTAAERHADLEGSHPFLVHPSSRAVAQNAGGGGHFTSPRIRSRCCLRPAIAGSARTRFAPGPPRLEVPVHRTLPAITVRLLLTAPHVPFRYGPRVRPCPLAGCWGHVSGLFRRSRSPSHA